MNVLEWTLARFTEQERAAAILGDLLEIAKTKGRAWFWANFARVLARLAWRGPAAWVVGYGVGVMLFEHFTTGDLASNSLNMSAGNPTTTVPMMAAMVVAALSVPGWFIAPYGAVRFGLGDGMSRLAVPLCAVATLGLWQSQSQMTMMVCAVLIIVTVLAALLLGQWRPVIALGATGCLGVGATCLVTDGAGLLAFHYGWSYGVRWVLVRVACMIGFAMVTAVYSLLHGLLGGRLRTFVSAACVVAASGVALAYVPDSPAVFVAADVHASPFSMSPQTRQVIKGDRIIMKDATMLTLISGAYGLSAKYVVGGPSWLEWNRYDVIAKMAPGIDPGDRKEMLQSLLKDRFKLVTHSEDRPQPAFALTVAKGKLKLKAGDPSVANKCESVPQPAPTADAVPYVVVRCVSQTPEMLTKIFPQMAGGYVTAPVLDQTELKGVWDFEIKWTARNQLTTAGADGISFFDALDKQLGLQLTPTTAPLPVLVVDSVNETPTPNAPDLAKVMPALPPAEFEVATIHPSKPDTEEDGDMNGLQINLRGVTLQVLIAEAWGVAEDGSTMVGVPKWLNTDKFDILAKATVNGPPTGAPPEFDEDDLRQMLQTFLEERFKLVTHMENQPMDAYNLVAAGPKMQKGDPAVRTGCKSGPGPDGKDPRIANPAINKLITCQNITMAQFAEHLQTMAPGYIKFPVLDETGLTGGWNFTLSYSGVGKLKGVGAPGPTADGQASDPNGAVSLIDALPRQTGVKLETVRRPVQMMVIDHVDEKPTEN